MTSEPAMAVRIDSDGGLELLIDLEYDTIKGAIDGWLEAAPTDGSCTIYLDEDGRRKGLDLNAVASVFWMTHGGVIPKGVGDLLRGPVVICGPPGGDGRETGLPASMLELVLTISNQWRNRGLADLEAEIRGLE